MLEASILIVVAFVFLIKSADWLVAAASKISTLFGISHLIVGLTVVALGTSAPELVVNLLAATGNHAGLVVGNIVGSNLINIALGIGVSALFLTLAVNRSVFREFSLLMGSTVLLILLFTKGQVQPPFTVGTWEGIILLVCFGLFMMHIYIDVRRGKEGVVKDLPAHVAEGKVSIWSTVGQLLAGIIGLVVSGHLVVSQCVKMGRLLGVGEEVVGITIVAIGTSIPDIVTSVVASCRGDGDMAIGNIVGSNIFNILLVLGVSSIVSAERISASGLEDDLLIILLVTAALYVSTWWYRRIGKVVAFLLVATYVVYMFWVVVHF